MPNTALPEDFIATPESSNVAGFKVIPDQEATGLGNDPKKAIVELIFKSGGRYRYTNVRLAVAEGIVSTHEAKASVGGYVSRLIVRDKTIYCQELDPETGAVIGEQGQAES